MSGESGTKAEPWSLSTAPVSSAYTMYRGRFGTYLPPLLEALGLAELTHEPRNNSMRAR